MFVVRWEARASERSGNKGGLDMFDTQISNGAKRHPPMRRINTDSYPLLIWLIVSYNENQWESVASVGS